MALEYSCFISYRRYDEELAKSFIENLKHALQSELVFYFEDMHIFIDKEEIPGGVYANTRIRNALCKSVCMSCHPSELQRLASYSSILYYAGQQTPSSDIPRCIPSCARISLFFIRVRRRR